MTVALDIITDALLNAGIGAIGDPIEDGMAQFCLRKLNRMIQSWANENLMLFDVYTDSFVMSAGVNNYSSALLTLGRPTSVDDAWVRLSNIDYPIDMISNQDYNAIAFKSTAGLPDRCYQDNGFPNIIFYFYPTPSSAYTAFFNLRQPLTGALTLQTTVSLPSGYEEALVQNLAVLVGPTFKRQADPVLMDRARETKAWIKRQTFVPLQMATNLPMRRRLYNIQRGY